MLIVVRKNGVIRKINTGFSWYYLFFGPLVPLFRGQGLEFLLVILAGIFTFGLSHFYFMFTLNERYLKFLLENGWTIGHPDTI